MTREEKEGMIDTKRGCGTCQHIDEWAGDCCHPESGGAVDIHIAIRECVDPVRKWWEPNYAIRKILNKEPTNAT
jgi:hypothetical protein